MSVIFSLVSGLVAGVFSGLFGIGGATILIPALIFLMGMDQHKAQGTALAAMLPPVGLLAALKYYYAGNMVISVALYAGIGFLIGGLIGATIAQPIPDEILRRAFAVYLLILAVRMFF